ncbi:hypothetical protein DYB26_003221 [Aphanomyces astaci]|uniref:Uncharacterized protein n=2 Tax=Aphanomyces astaci TaxID=112090 RepID=A0A3R6ZZ45_APHAT|nr:hypothetical protein DYB34_006901 [Aphanomyces astaci]RHY80944.1 hypothetical protein DYB26_003221 [Aphanomyces astaci]
MLAPQQLIIASALAVWTASADVYGTNVVHFKPPFKAFDPNHHKAVFSHFRTCSSQCSKDDSYDPYAGDPWGAFASLGGYTACVSSCLAHEILQLVTYYKSTYAKLLDVTENQLRLTKGYIAGTTDFDLIGNRTHVGYSCVLPDEYFIKWANVVVEVPIYFDNRGNGYTDTDPVYGSLVRADKYLSYCNNVVQGDTSIDFNALDDANGLGGLKVACNQALISYLTEVKQTIGHSILHPQLASTVPDGSCTKRTNCHVTLKPNPKATAFTAPYVCVAEKTLAHYAATIGYPFYLNENREDDYAYLQDLVIRPVNGDTGACDDVVINSTSDGDEYTPLTISFKKVPSHHLELFTISGLPSYFGDAGKCTLEGTLGDAGAAAITHNDADCVKHVDTDVYAHPTEDAPLGAYQTGAFEFSNARQYLNHLAFHATYSGICEGFEDNTVGRLSTADQINGNPVTNPSVFENEPYSIACLYRVFSLKCDCMQAVLQCYSLQAQYTTALGKTLGRAASVLCGFVLCQKASVYKLFLNAQGVAHTTILAEVLLQATSDHVQSSLPMASAALVSFGLGMVAFVAAKTLKSASAKKSSMDDGYANLI